MGRSLITLPPALAEGAPRVVTYFVELDNRKGPDSRAFKWRADSRGRGRQPQSSAWRQPRCAGTGVLLPMDARAALRQHPLRRALRLVTQAGFAACAAAAPKLSAKGAFAHRDPSRR